MNHVSWGAKWVEIDLDAVRHNYRQVRRHVPGEVKVLGVVKGDAYGHGAVEIARILGEEGIDYLGVTTVDEGMELRDNGVNLPILVFAPFLPEDIDDIVSGNLTVTLVNRQSVGLLKDYLESRPTSSIKTHLKVETGMGRLGFWPQEVGEIAREITDIPGLLLEGVYSHLATAMQRNKTSTEKQYKDFQTALEILEKAGYTGLIRHISNSAALLEFPAMKLDMVRTGTLLYGQFPSPQLEGTLDLREPWSLKARVLHVRELPPGHGVGYGQTFITSKKTRVAVLPLGFMDGLQMEPVLKPVNLWELLKGIIKLFLQYLGHQRVSQPVIFPGGRARVIGKVGMQLTMADVTGISGVEIGAVCQVPIRRTAVSPGIPRVYMEKQEVRGIKETRGMTREVTEWAAK